MHKQIQKFKIQKYGKYFYRGNWDEKLFKNSIAIVGSRQMTKYGQFVIDKFVSDFVINGVTTISGFMYGVDTEVAKKTVEYGGRHIAVFGCGLDVVYPSENEKLYSDILEIGGLVISEYEPNAKPHLWKFPQRNKIVVDLASIGVLVIEAGLKSGSLVTADLAKKARKKIWAVPGPINSKVSEGCNKLIKSRDAEMAVSVADILGNSAQQVAGDKKTEKSYSFGNKQEEQIYRILQLEALEIDEIAVKLGISVVEIGTTLSIMEIKGFVIESGGKYFLA